MYGLTVIIILFNGGFMRKLLLLCFSFLLCTIFINAQPDGVQSTITSTPNDTLNYINSGGGVLGVAGDGYVAGTNHLGHLGKYQRFDLSQGYLLKAFRVYIRVRELNAVPADTLSFVVKTVNGDGTPGTTLTTIKKATDVLLSPNWNLFTLTSPLPIGKSIFIGCEWLSTVKDTFGIGSDLSGQGNGNGAHRAWEKWADGTYHAMDAANAWGSAYDIDLWIGAIAEKILPISAARIDANADLIPDRANDTLTVSGVVMCPNYQTVNRSYYISDGTGGMSTFAYGLLSPALNLGDSIVIRGKLTQYNGLDELTTITDNTIWVVGTNAKVMDPIVITPGTFNATAEQNECQLIEIKGAWKIGGTWPALGTSVNDTITNGKDTLVMRIDSDTDIDGQPEPGWPKDVIGVLTQFASTGTYNTGYQLQPRYYATDFLAVTPVELSSFSASVSSKSVMLNWSTATEKNNMGFEIQRSSDKVSFAKVGFINGNG
ncbi:MAG: hypothetical protein P4L41_05595, partial [Flavipsychrobacter sp.]|nr:hypothetical protein [Flavipsychrobacter sp.]